MQLLKRHQPQAVRDLREGPLQQGVKSRQRNDCWLAQLQKDSTLSYTYFLVT
jgi:hypothetical protein